MNPLDLLAVIFKEILDNSAPPPTPRYWSPFIENSKTCTGVDLYLFFWMHNIVDITST